MDMEQYYNQDKYTKINRFRQQAIIEFIRPDAERIFDVGCGEGILGESVKNNRQVTYEGVDISETTLKKAAERLDKTYLLNLEKDFTEWPEDLKKVNFDTIILSELLEHLFYPGKLLLNLKKLCDSKTEFIITVPNILFWKNRLKIFFGSFEYTNEGLMDRGHIHFFSWRSFKGLLNDCGLQISGVNNHVPTRGTKCLSKFFPGLFSFQFIVKAKKYE